MTVTQDLSFLSLITHASLLVQLVMALLLSVSLMSWTYIFRKMFAIRSAQKQTEDFERIFWSGGNLNNLYEDAMSARRQRMSKSGALERIFEAAWENSTRFAPPSPAKARSTAASCLTARAGRCAPPISARWMRSIRIWHFLLRSARCHRMSACSAPYGAS